MPAMCGASQLNNVSRTRSGVGLRPGASAKFHLRPRRVLTNDTQFPYSTLHARSLQCAPLPEETRWLKAAEKPDFWARLREQLARSASRLAGDFTGLFRGRKIDAELLDDLEARLIGADVGMAATEAVLENLRTRVARRELADVDALLARGCAPSCSRSCPRAHVRW